MLIGYARTSTLDQKAGLDAQIRDLEVAGCKKLFVEQVSSVDVAQRQKLTDALDYLREGDTLVVTKLDRLARSVAHLHSLLALITEKGASLKILNMGIDTSTPTGKLMLNILGGVAEFEREIMLERQREGIQKAKEAGKYKGRKPYSEEVVQSVREARKAGATVSALAKDKGFSRTTIYKMLAD